jgi:hypothetical protein
VLPKWRSDRPCATAAFTEELGQRFAPGAYHDDAPTSHRRRSYPCVRQPAKTQFTVALWARWLAEQRWSKVPPEAQVLHLRAGLADFRRRLCREGAAPIPELAKWLRAPRLF